MKGKASRAREGWLGGWVIGKGMRVQLFHMPYLWCDGVDIPPDRLEDVQLHQLDVGGDEMALAQALEFLLRDEGREGAAGKGWRGENEVRVCVCVLRGREIAYRSCDELQRGGRLAKRTQHRRHHTPPHTVVFVEQA